MAYGLQPPPPKRARAIREEAGVSQEQIARALDVHRVTIARWESGERRPVGRRAHRYSELLRALEGAMPQ